MTPREKIGIGLWGYGPHARKNIIPALLASPDCQLVGICTTRDDKAADIQAQYDVVVWRNPETMLADARTQAVYVATPIGLHYAHGQQVLAADKHLLCEKSLTNNGSQSRALIEAAAQNGVVIFETFMYLYHPQFQLVREIVGSADFGPITSLTGNFCIPRLENPGFRYAKKLGGSAFWDVGCYPVSLTLALLNEPAKIEFFDTVVPAAQAVDVAGKALLAYTSGAAYLHWSYDHSYTNDVTILGEKKSLYVDRVFSKSRDQISTVTVMDTHGAATDLAVPAADSFVKMFEVFAQTVQDARRQDQLRDQARRQAVLMSRLWMMKNG